MTNLLATIGEWTIFLLAWAAIVYILIQVDAITRRLAK
jgi:hypothetical protein